MDYANASFPTPKHLLPGLLRTLLQAWRSASTSRRTAEPPPLVELGAHLLRDIDVPGRIDGRLREHSELARYDRRQQYDKY